MDLNFYSLTKKIASTASCKKFVLFLLVSVVFFTTANAQVAANAIDLDGNDDYVQVPVHPSLNISNAITIETWINYRKNSGTQDAVSKSSAENNDSYIFPRTTDGWRTVEFLLYINGMGWQTLQVPFSGATQAKRNQWHHLAATFDGFWMSIYVNGVLAGTQPMAGTITVNNNPLWIGGHNG
jgi:hypothetical protein